jgi:hypothetical protein
LESATEQPASVLSGLRCRTYLLPVPFQDDGEAIVASSANIKAQHVDARLAKQAQFAGLDLPFHQSPHLIHREITRLSDAFDLPNAFSSEMCGSRQDAGVITASGAIT